MLVLCARVYLAVYFTIKTEETCLKRHITSFYFNIRKGEGIKVISNFRKEVQTKLTRGLLDMIILQYLEHEPMHGYQVITQIRKGLGVTLRPSSVYPVLQMLEKKGCVQSAWSMDAEKPRKVFSLTNEGKNLLRFTENSLKFICKNMEADYKSQIQATSKSFDRLTC
jgi:PadR family transcriptional regulator PadR